MSSVGTVNVSGGSFMIDVNGQSRKIEIGSLMMAVNLGYVGELDTQIADKLSEMVERNTQIEAAIELTAFVSESKEKGRFDISEKLTIGGTEKTVAEWFEDLGVDCRVHYNILDPNPSSSVTETFNTELDALTESLQSTLELLNTDSESATLELQNLTEKRANALQQASNLMNSANEATQAVLRNF